AEMTVTEIAGAVGIPDCSLFAKSFRRKFGITPTFFMNGIIFQGQF
ncbi:MAG: AraC family transcriptional regulator, partial [Clostridia bacterium]|nr:AraC family transcriptional regulator [Clostridia bacterium]